ncbi:MAG: MBL fold metallo-hydrolase, partial [Spirochaetota bacterium]
MKFEHIEGKTYILNNKGITSCLYNLKDNKYAIIDPGHLNKKNYKEYIEYLEKENILPEYIFCTHGHVDHANSIVYLKKEFGSKVIMPEYESYFFDNPNFFIDKVIRAKSINYEEMYPSPSIKVDYIVKRENAIIVGGKKFKVERLPGHSFNHCGFSTPDNVLYLGDSLLSQDVIKKTKIPYIFDIDND